MTSVEPPKDLTFKAAIQSAALNTFSNLNFKRSVINNPAYKYIFDPSAEGHGYYKYCLEACHVQSPNVADLFELVEQYKEPQIIIPMLREPNIINFEKKINSIFASAKMSLSRLIEAQASIEACVACVKAVISFHLPAHSNDPIAPKLYRRKVEQEYEFAARLAYAIITFILMTISNDWSTFFKPYFCWILRLADVSATTQHHHTLILTLVSLFRMENLIDKEEHTDILAFIEATELPNVSKIFNNHQGLLGTRKNYPLTKATKPNNGTSSEPPVEPLKTNYSTIDPDYIFGDVLADVIKTSFTQMSHTNQGFMPYQPLDPQLVLKEPQPMEQFSAHLSKCLNTLLENINYELNASNSWSVKRNNISHASERSLYSKRRPFTHREFGTDNNSRHEGSWEKTIAWAQEEVGIAEDGSLLGRSTGEQRLGLGAGSKNISPAEELYEDYRRQRAHKYHKSIAMAHSERQTISELGIDPSKICCICQKPGHFARECKFGLT